MSTLIVEVKVDLSNQSQVSEFMNFLGKISGGSIIQNSIPVQAEKETPKAEKPAAKVPSPKPTPKKVEETKVEVEEPQEKEEDTSADAPSDQDITFNDVKNMMASKIDEYRDEIKKKMVELGAKNMSTLKEEDYADFHQFLSEL